MALIGTNSYEFEKTGVTATVANNDIAKCMYYLACVCNTVECNEGNIRRFTDYKNYWRLDDDDEEMVYKLCLTLSPDEFEDKVFFENDRMCGNSSNEFYNIAQVQNRIMVVQSLMVAGRTRRVQKIMTYKRQWMINNYFGPMNRLADRFNPQRRLMRAMVESDCVIS